MPRGAADLRETSGRSVFAGGPVPLGIRTRVPCPRKESENRAKRTIGHSMRSKPNQCFSVLSQGLPQPREQRAFSPPVTASVRVLR